MSIQACALYAAVPCLNSWRSSCAAPIQAPWWYSPVICAQPAITGILSVTRIEVLLGAPSRRLQAALYFFVALNMSSYPSNTNNSSTTTVSSTQTLVPKKDYASAFADLQSKYGFGGNAPSPNPEPNTTQAASKKAPSRKEDKALADLAGKYEFGGSQSQQKQSWL
ncbi:hypothetical protein IW261DRAFT_1609032 [Armillaria novae-zelandiae]|uniref:Uncharacterized protein n=1 Tax=Armillaria novae-zelandiae TaxID=153914 RepID=A0AA39UCI9_9AGAR|nr:hypothetical protein IW261DRAFT_1609032 [Armillaria novae-zelandiae]